MFYGLFGTCYSMVTLIFTFDHVQVNFGSKRPNFVAKSFISKQKISCTVLSQHSKKKKIDARQLKTPKIASQKVKPSLLPGFPAIAQTTMAYNFVHLLSVHGSIAYVAFFNIFEKFYFISIYFLKVGFLNIGCQKPKFEIAIL